jgi:hypothetical protein
MNIPHSLEQNLAEGRVVPFVGAGGEQHAEHAGVDRVTDEVVRAFSNELVALDDAANASQQRTTKAKRALASGSSVILIFGV